MSDPVDGPAENRRADDDDLARLEAWRERVTRTSYIRRAGWFVNIAYYLAYQWLVADTHDGRSDIIEIIEDDGKIRLTLNEIMPYVEHMVAKYAAARAKLQVIPKVGFGQDAKKNRDAARDTESLLTFLEEKQNLTVHDQHLAWWMLCTGTAIEKVYWDEYEGRKKREAVEEDVPVMDPETGAPIIGEYERRQATDPETGDLMFREYNEGEVMCAAVSPFRFVIDPDQQLDTAPRVCELQPCTLEEIEEEFGKAIADKISSGGEDGGGLALWEKRMLSLENPNCRWQEWGADDKAKMYLKCEYWERPSKKHPRGLHIVSVGGEILGAKGELPMNADETDFMYGKRMFPYIAVQDVLRPFRFHGGAVLDHMVPLQKLFNAQFSRIIEHERKFVGKWVAGVDSVESEEQFTDIEGEVILYDPAGGNNPAPKIEARSPMPGYVTDLLDRIAAKIDDVGGRHEISQGRMPMGVKSGKQAALMAEKDDTRLGAKFVRWAQFRVERAKMQVSVAKRYYDEPREITKTHDQHGRFRPSAVNVLGKDLEDNVTFAQGSEFPMNREQRQDQARQNWQDGVYGDPKSIRAVVGYMKEAGAGNINETFEPFWRAIEKAQGENEMLAQGGMVKPPAPWELHEIELEEHRNFWMSEEARALPPDALQQLEMHIDMTMQAMNPQAAVAPPGAPPMAAPPPGQAMPPEMRMQGPAPEQNPGPMDEGLPEPSSSDELNYQLAQMT